MIGTHNMDFRKNALFLEPHVIKIGIGNATTVIIHFFHGKAVPDPLAYNMTDVSGTAE